jgi:hypothetical protein
MVQYVIKKVGIWKRMQFWFDFTGHSNHQEAIKNLEKQIFESTFKYTERDQKLQDGEIIFNMRTGEVSTQNNDSKSAEKFSVQLINFETDNLYISGYINGEPFRIAFKIEEKGNSLTNRLKYVKAKMSTVEKEEKLNYWGLENKKYPDNNDVILDDQFDYKSHFASLQMGTIEVKDGKIKIQSEDFFYYYYKIHKSKENSNIISISIYYSSQKYNEDNIQIIMTDFYFTLTENRIVELTKNLKQQMTCQLNKNLFFGEDNAYVIFDNFKQINFCKNKIIHKSIFGVTLTIDTQSRILNIKGNSVRREVSVDIKVNNLPLGHPCEIKFTKFIDLFKPKENSFIELKTVTSAGHRLLFPDEYATLPSEVGHARNNVAHNTHKSQLLKTKRELTVNLIAEMEYAAQTNSAIEQDSETAFYSKVPVRTNRLKAGTLNPSDKQTE